ncbi:MAG: ribosomal protein S18-alanine N-acetyltransferase [Pseudazoarcus pumilus]|nr:ribosomal protein S18-alanine N-acetyltransferase [Pseudazoarcus pumilus]
MNAALSFDPMVEDDLDWVVAHERELHAFPWSHGNFADSLGAGYLANVLRLGEERVAYAVMMMVMDEAHLLNLSVIRSRQGAGLGRVMLEMLFELALRQGASQLFLEVRPSNTVALALYRSCGCEPVGRRKRYYPATDGGREDAILMRRPL